MVSVGLTVLGVYEKSNYEVSAAGLPLHLGPATGLTTILSGATDTIGLDLSFSDTPIFTLPPTARRATIIR
jgi:hypothetical protein